MPDLAKTYSSIAITLMAGSMMMFSVPDLIINLLAQTLSIEPAGPFTGVNKVAGVLILLLSLMLLLEAWNCRRRTNSSHPKGDKTSMSETIIAQCSECEGTGLKIGWAEKDGAAIVCRRCHGSGSQEISYTPFTGRRENPQALRVWQRNPGYRVSPEHTDGGVLVADWLANPELALKPEAAMQSTVCPAMWYQQKTFKECSDNQRYHQCPLWTNKARCWDDLIAADV